MKIRRPTRQPSESAAAVRSTPGQTKWDGAVMAMDPQTGKIRWKVTQFDVTDGGMLTTATDLLFTGGREGYFHALDAKTGKQYVSVISGHTLVTFGLRE